MNWSSYEKILLILIHLRINKHTEKKYSLIKSANYLYKINFLICCILKKNFFFSDECTPFEDNFGCFKGDIEYYYWGSLLISISNSSCGMIDINDNSEAEYSSNPLLGESDVYPWLNNGNRFSRNLNEGFWI